MSREVAVLLAFFLIIFAVTQPWAVFKEYNVVPSPEIQLKLDTIHIENSVEGASGDITYEWAAQKANHWRYPWEKPDDPVVYAAAEVGKVRNALLGLLGVAIIFALMIEFRKGGAHYRRTIAAAAAIAVFLAVAVFTRAILGGMARTGYHLNVVDFISGYWFSKMGMRICLQPGYGWMAAVGAMLLFAYAAWKKGY